MSGGLTSANSSPWSTSFGNGKGGINSSGSYLGRNAPGSSAGRWRIFMALFGLVRFFLTRFVGGVDLVVEEMEEENVVYKQAEDGGEIKSLLGVVILTLSDLFPCDIKFEEYNNLSMVEEIDIGMKTRSHTKYNNT